MPKFHQMALGVVGVLAVSASWSAIASAEDAKRKLTCTFIAKQCVTGCSKEAPVEFCRPYCADTRATCLQTGRWDGIRRQYTNVRKR